MLKMIVPLVLLLVGTGTGIGAGMFLRPAPEAVTEVAKSEEGKEKKDQASADPAPKEEAPALEYVKMNNQFVVPVVKNQTVVALVVLSLSLEVPEGSKEAVFRMEPKLRDSFLQVLFDHANLGGFDGAFTATSNLNVLRTALREAGQKDMDVETIRDVLILEIARQDY